MVRAHVIAAVVSTNHERCHHIDDVTHHIIAAGIATNGGKIGKQSSSRGGGIYVL
jgi:hypothetical protein